jgi:hypothetical protein
MTLQTTVRIPKANFEIRPTDKLLFVGSCFADRIGGMFRDNHFKAVVNPFGVMYNPASVLHTIEKMHAAGQKFDTVFITLGTNHVYILNETGEIVDNCQKRPSALFTEKELSIEECGAYLQQCVSLLREDNPDVHVVFTVSPIRYAKYGYHESQLSKATLLLAVNSSLSTPNSSLSYFPSYEIMMEIARQVEIKAYTKELIN